MQMSVRKLVLVLINVCCLYANVQCQILPKEIQKCHFGDYKCMIESINMVIRKYPKGIPEIGLMPIDVVEVPDVSLTADRSPTTWIQISFSKQVNYGFENTTITGIDGFKMDPTKEKIRIRGRIPSLIHKGAFHANGRALGIEMNSTGESSSDFQDFQFILNLKVILEYRNNKRYMKIYELVPVVTMKRWILWLEDLFPENTDLTIAVNKLINDNWIQFWNELEPKILEVVSVVFMKFANGLFGNISYDDLFLT